MRGAAGQLFVVSLAVDLVFKELAKRSALIFSGPVGWILSKFAERLLGHMITEGILYLDLAMMARRVDREELDYRKAILEAYEKTKGKAVSDEEKARLRKLVIDATRAFVRVRAQSKNT